MVSDVAFLAFLLYSIFLLYSFIFKSLMTLSYQLLLNETPELEAQRREALEREERLSGERDAARLDVLSQLATARGQDLLQESQEQGGLLSSLEATQSKAKEIAIALEESRQSLDEVLKYFRKFLLLLY